MIGDEQCVTDLETTRTGLTAATRVAACEAQRSSARCVTRSWTHAAVRDLATPGASSTRCPVADVTCIFAWPERCRCRGCRSSASSQREHLGEGPGSLKRCRSAVTA